MKKVTLVLVVSAVLAYSTSTSVLARYGLDSDDIVINNISWKKGQKVDGQQKPGWFEIEYSTKVSPDQKEIVLLRSIAEKEVDSLLAHLTEDERSEYSQLKVGGTFVAFPQNKKGEKRLFFCRDDIGQVKFDASKELVYNGDYKPCKIVVD